MRQQQQRIEPLEAEVKAQKKLKGTPKIRASRLNEPAEEGKQPQVGKRAGSAKVSKKSRLEIKEEQIIEPEHIPAGAVFKGYREYDIQELQLEGIVRVSAVEKMTQAALVGGVVSQTMNPNLRILSDGGGQFNVLTHGLCWVHAERGLRRLQAETEQQRQNITQLQDLLWDYDQQLKQYQQSPTATPKTELWDAFDAIFQRCYLHHESLNQVLDWFCTHKVELLRVLDYPPFPLHNRSY
jgi:hypothetical protein